MKIKSPFKDYYDYVQHLYGGGDPKITYDRRRIGEFKDLGSLRSAEEVEVEVDDIPPLISPFAMRRDMGIVYWLIVAARPFPVINVTRTPNAWGFSTYPEKLEVVDADKHSRFVYPRGRTNFLGEGIHVTKIGEEDPRLIPLSRAVGHPVFIIRDHKHGSPCKVTVDGNCPILNDMGLASVYPAEQIYQDLSYFIGNRMHPSPDMMPPTKSTDKEKIQQHGFDVKQSFRHRKDK